MKTIKATGEPICESRQEIAGQYFNTFGDGISSVYAKGNMGIVTLLSDLQHQIELGFTAGEKEYWRKVLNNIKSVLIEDDRKAEEASGDGSTK